MTVAEARRRKFYACYPNPRFPAISITGESCALSCKHCNHHYLHSMVPCPFPDLLFKTCAKLEENGARGVLLSGGYNSEGYVPFDPFLDEIEKIKRETDLFISAHTGLVPDRLAKELGRAGVDQADFDIIGEDDTIKSVLGLDRRVEDFGMAMNALDNALPHVAPHICIGLHGGELKGEHRALEMATKIDPSVLVLLVIIPTKGTAFEEVDSPPLERVEEMFKLARQTLPETEIALGCMRPRAGREDLELAALRAGVSRIEIPSQSTIKAAEQMGLQVQKLEACCSVPPEVVEGFVGRAG